MKHVPLSFDDHSVLGRYRRFWNIDYPLLSYIKENGKQLVMTHLADPDATNRTIILKDDEEFVSFVEKFPVTGNASFSFIIRINGVVCLRTYEYDKPFQKKDFDDDAFWT